jgi:hypothetical protein
MYDSNWRGANLRCSTSYPWVLILRVLILEVRIPVAASWSLSRVVLVRGANRSAARAECPGFRSATATTDNCLRSYLMSTLLLTVFVRTSEGFRFMSDEKRRYRSAAWFAKTDITARINGWNRRVLRQREAESFDHAGHRGGRSHSHAVARGARHARLGFHEILQAQGARSRRVGTSWPRRSQSSRVTFNPTRPAIASR